MDLVTLIAACALSVEPKVMHALILEQSGAEPWSFSVPGESLPRVLSTIQDAVREARAARPDGGRIRVGLTGQSTTARSATAAMFAPCPNITLAARQISRFVDRCKAASKAEPFYCAIAAYRGSWDRPDAGFADAVRATVEIGNAPNFDMPKDAYFDPNDLASETLTRDPHAAPTAPELTSVDRARVWSSALFPAKPAKPDNTSADMQNHDRDPKEKPSSAPGRATLTTPKPPADNLFVPRSSDRR